jgi:hypothetical protein
MPYDYYSDSMPYKDNRHRDITALNKTVLSCAFYA